MYSVFDQLNWEEPTDANTLIQLVSTQLDEQEEIRKRIRQQLAKDYPPEALSWLPTVTWNAATLVPLSSFDLRGIEKWPTWGDKAKIKLFTDKIQSGWHKPIIAVKTPGSRYLNPIDGHTRLSVYWKLKRPVLTFVGKAHAHAGPWDDFHRQQHGMSKEQREAGFASIVDQLLEFDNDFASGGSAVRHVRSARGVYFFHEPIGTPITEAQYQALLAARKAARAANPPGHPERVKAERAVRQARKARSAGSTEAGQDDVAQELAEVHQQADTLLKSVQTDTNAESAHSQLLNARREAQAQYPAGHPERVKAERAVRQSRAKVRKSGTPEMPHSDKAVAGPVRSAEERLANAEHSGAPSFSSPHSASEGMNKPSVVMYPDGSRWIDKTSSSAGEADSEQLASWISDILGAGAPQVVRKDETRTITPFVEGKTPAQLWHEASPGRFPDNDVAKKLANHFNDLTQTKRGKLIGLLDLITDNSDRSEANWIVNGDEITPIDHGLAWTRAPVPLDEMMNDRWVSPFVKTPTRWKATGRVDRYYELSPRDFSPQQLSGWREKLAQLASNDKLTLRQRTRMGWALEIFDTFVEPIAGGSQ